MKDKVYEMRDDYKKAVEDLLGFIKLREELAKTLKTAVPERVRELHELLAEMDKSIDACEAALANQYEAYQTKCRAEEELDEMSAEVEKRVEIVFIYIKHRHPEKFDELKTAIFANLTPEEIQDFYDRVAIREATELEEIIAENKEE